MLPGNTKKGHIPYLVDRMFWSYVEIHCVKPVEEEIAVFKKRCVLCLFHSV